MNNTTKNLILLAIFIVSMALIFIGQKDTGYPGLGMEVVGIVGLVSVLFIYNKRFK